jgi:hypothetical protein
MMTTTKVILASIVVVQFPSSIRSQQCLPDTEFELFVNNPCNYESLLTSIQQRLDYPDELYDVIPCPHAAAEELLLHFPDDATEESISSLISDWCKAAMDAYDTENMISWSDVTQKGEKFDKEYYDGNGDWNEEHQSNYPHPPHVPGRASNVLNRDVERVDDLYESIIQRYPLEWPDTLTNFEDCQYQSAMCCWTTDRQANDHNGNCETPYDENCLDADPGDNTDLCSVDMGRSIKDSVHVDGGFALFPENTEGPIHCHGLAWGEDESEADYRFRANNLFFVSMSDHLHDRGYVRAVQGAPMCACVENMPIVSRSDCTEITATETYKFTFPASTSGNIQVSLDYVDLDFNACKANQNNNLQRFYERLLNEGRVSREKYEKFRNTVVGNGQCAPTNKLLLFDKGYKFQAPEYDGWTQLYGRGSMISPNTQPELWETIGTDSIVRRICRSCSHDTHKDIIYKRLTPKGGVDFKDLFLNHWRIDENVRTSDFNLFSSIEDAENEANPWQFCNYNDWGIGFPRDCGPTGKVNSEWVSMRGHGETDFAFYLYNGNS